jgi:hypothetical protein
MRLIWDRRASCGKHERCLMRHVAYDAAAATCKVALGRPQSAVAEIRNRQAVLLQRRAELALARQQFVDPVVRAPFAEAIQARQGLGPAQVTRRA